MTGEPRPPRLSHERYVTLLAALAALPAVVVAVILLWTGDLSSKVQWTLTALVVGSWLIFAVALHERVVRPLQTLSNMIAALHEQDYSLRARRRSPNDALGLAMLELNTLGQQLREQRLGVLEATALLRRVMEEIDVAIFAFDGAGSLRLVNRAGERLLGRPADALTGDSAENLGLGTALGRPGDGNTIRILEREFPGGRGKWEVRRSTFRQGGLPLQLLVLADVSQTLRDEERQAWQRLVRVLGHEINNSLAPIKSVAGSLTELVARKPRPADADDDLARGLQVIEGRAEGLSRFLASYARLARLPPPKRGPLQVDQWVRRVAALETRLPINVRPGPAVTIHADGDQLDQLLINLVANAVDASLEAHRQGGEVTIGWNAPNGALEVSVQDDGPGLPATGNLFVPFFTTKPQGTGIGLALSRQIAEAHGGTVSLRNRADGPGCEATLRLPR
jgi:nitrogen fixation/metabolism regulation signal transduction histidine kinase